MEKNIFDVLEVSWGQYHDSQRKKHFFSDGIVKDRRDESGIVLDILKTLSKDVIVDWQFFASIIGHKNAFKNMILDT